MSGEVEGGQKRKALIQNLFEANSEKVLNDAVEAAKAAGIAGQATLEARFLFLVDQGDFAALAHLGPVLQKQRESFRIDDSIIFSVPEEFYSIIEYCFALEALEAGELARFEKHIKEAFWLSPGQAAAFAPHIDRLRRDQSLADLKVDLDQAYLRQSDGKKEILKARLGNRDYLVINFWSPWNPESEAHLPDFLAMVNALETQKIPVISMLIEAGDEALTEAREFCARLSLPKTDNWLVDTSRQSLARELRVLELPTITVLERDGSVLFSGHPSEKLLWNTLKKIDPKLERPRINAVP